MRKFLIVLAIAAFINTIKPSVMLKSVNDDCRDVMKEMLKDVQHIVKSLMKMHVKQITNDLLDMFLRFYENRHCFMLNQLQSLTTTFITEKKKVMQSQKECYLEHLQDVISHAYDAIQAAVTMDAETIRKDMNDIIGLLHNAADHCRDAK